jgi:hypothetical protein
MRTSSARSSDERSARLRARTPSRLNASQCRSSPRDMRVSLTVASIEAPSCGFCTEKCARKTATSCCERPCHWTAIRQGYRLAHIAGESPVAGHATSGGGSPTRASIGHSRSRVPTYHLREVIRSKIRQISRPDALSGERRTVVCQSHRLQHFRHCFVEVPAAQPQHCPWQVIPVAWRATAPAQSSSASHYHGQHAQGGGEGQPAFCKHHLSTLSCPPRRPRPAAGQHALEACMLKACRLQKQKLRNRVMRRRGSMRGGSRGSCRDPQE